MPHSYFSDFLVGAVIFRGLFSTSDWGFYLLTLNIAVPENVRFLLHQL